MSEPSAIAAVGSERWRWSRRVAVLTALALAGTSGLAAATAQVGRTGAAAVAVRSDHATFDAPYLDGLAGPQPAESINLAGTWDFRIKQTFSCPASNPIGEVGPRPQCVNVPSSDSTTIQVPGGGWVKQGFDNVAEAVYSREVTVPDTGESQATKLFFGAVNHRSTLTIAPVGGGESRTVGTNTTSFTPSVFDITRYVKPGETYTISVDVKGREALRDPAGYYTVPEAASWSPNVAQGIFRSARLEVFPAVHITDAFVRTSVADRSLTYDVSVTNASGTDETRWLSGDVRSWNKRGWKYPQIPLQQVTVPAGKTRVVTVGPLPWLEDKDSYWWPNVPYRAGYRAQLHDLRLQLSDERPASGSGNGNSASGETASALVRFGFRETRQVGDHFELNGIRVNFRGDSLQTANYDGINHGGRGDAVDTLPGFLKPTENNPGWPRAVDNYLRLNYSNVRIHQIPATPYMLEVADEMGLMIHDETAIRGSNARQNFITGRDNMVDHLRDLVLRDRNHASVLRWSQANEPGIGGSLAGRVWAPGSGKTFNQLLYETVMSLDDTRPISTDAGPGETSDNDLPHPNYATFCHYTTEDSNFAIGQYTDYPCRDVFLPGKPYGQGEFIWPNDNTQRGLAWFATATEKMREKGASDTRPYTLLSAWANVIPGVRTTDMVIEQGGPPLYGEDNLPDPWTHPQIQRVQKSFHPVLVADRDYWEANKQSNDKGEWPASPVKLERGKPTTRTLVIFNDTLAGQHVNVRWELRRGSPTGPVAAADTSEVLVPLGRHVERKVSFTPPATSEPLYLVLSASKPGQGQLFHDADTRFE